MGNGLVNCGSGSLTHGLCVKNTFVHLQNTPASAKVRTRSCEARFASEFDRTNDCPFDARISTVILKNIPCRCTPKEVLDCVHDVGFEGKYTMFHMPRRSNHQNFGYAYFSFEDSADVAKFYEKMSGIRIGGRNSEKRIVVALADVQSVTGPKKVLKRSGEYDCEIRSGYSR